MTQQTGSVLGVALFGRSGNVIAGAHVALVISAGLLIVSGVVIAAPRSPSSSPGPHRR